MIIHLLPEWINFFLCKCETFLNTTKDIQKNADFKWFLISIT